MHGGVRGRRLITASYSIFPLEREGNCAILEAKNKVWEVLAMQERKRPMPVGIEDFKKLVQND